MSKLVTIIPDTPIEDIIAACMRNPAGAKLSCPNQYTRMDILNRIARGTFPWIKTNPSTGDPTKILFFTPLNKCDIHIQLRPLGSTREQGK